ncbi:hypothetical protein B2J86_17110 [Acidovorax sp. SRB_14]|uniref:hypothetical protein n=1 Tax=Acidovorax sp. SRB_14 TaxID=1962699 RepID=UPI001563E7C7|nr:hypothetical protein [Acidovorax sp. SRB_14]NMM82620.1 hypothetical protein [Acidovorax sp. SRB_14]
MLLVKTTSGQQALKERHGVLSARQRTAFILFDGKRATAEVLAATAAMGITHSDVEAMLEQGLLAPAAGSAAAAPPGGPGSGRSDQDRYQAAYPIAIEITAALGLRGFRLNLAVEGTGGYEALAALAPRIREAVGEAPFARLERALFA